MGTGWDVRVLTDRGLESPRLFELMVAHGWHPLMRVKSGGKFQPAGGQHFHGLSDFAGYVGARDAGIGRAYKTSPTPLDCTLLACWEPGHEEPWLLLTDLTPRASNPVGTPLGPGSSRDSRSSRAVAGSSRTRA